MNIPAVKRFKQMLAADQPAYGLWVTLESASITEMAVALGLDWVVVDAEHGHLDWREILDHVRAAVRSHTVVLVRLAELQMGLVKRALDIGADGVVIPWMEFPEQLRQAVAFSRYPPGGRRGMGGERATCWGRCLVQNAAEADDHVLVVPIIESVTGGRNIEQLCQVPGVEVFFLGPADYSATAGYPGQWEGPGVAEQLLAVKDAVRRHGRQCGVVATSNENLVERRDQGFRMLGVGLDGGLLLRSLSGGLTAVGRDAPLVTTLAPTRGAEPATAADRAGAIASGDARKAAAPLREPAGASGAAHLGPLTDRVEAISHLQTAPRVEIDRGVIFRPLAGRHNKARDLTTGIVSFVPAAQLAYHTHPYAESVTLVSGRMAIEVEGRRYMLDLLDNIHIPAGTAHHAINLSPHQSATIHIAMASDTPTRTLVEPKFPRHDMPANTAAPAGPERISRSAAAGCQVPSPGVRLQEFLGRQPGTLQLSGGHALIEPGASLPPLVLDSDESILVLRGTATCLVEGRRYTLSQDDSLLCPSGLRHSVLNESQQPVALLWVCAP